MKLKSILAAIAIMASYSLFAQNATKADLERLANQLNTLSQKVIQLDINLDRIISENVNLVEQLNVKTITSAADVNGIQWDIVRVEPNIETNDVVITFRVINHSGKNHDCSFGFNMGSAIDTDSNLSNNVYVVKNSSRNPSLSNLISGTPINIQGVIKNVPNTSSYLASITLDYIGSRTKGTQNGIIKFTGVHIPW